MTAPAPTRLAPSLGIAAAPPDRAADRAAERTGAQVLCEALVREGVDLMFGIPGGAIMPFYHALLDYRGRLRHVLCRHEQGAGHAAEGYARATGRVGVCVATSGPGATNLVTPLANAWMDGTPLVAITGQVPSALLGTDAFQETDILGVTLPVTKHGFQVTDARDLPEAVRAAFALAQRGRPGPVLIDVTKDALQARVVPAWPGAARRAAAARPPAERVRAAVELLAGAERPLVLAGNGVIQAGGTEALRALAERLSLPVVTTLHGLGALSQDHPLCLGMPGMHGWVHVNRAIQECDVLFNVGSRFDDRVTGRRATFAPRARVVHVDVEPAEIGKLVRADVGLVGDARASLEAILAALPAGAPPARDAWLGRLAALRAEFEPRQTYRRRPAGTALAPHDVYAALDDALAARDDWRVVTDVGQHQMWAAQLLTWRRPRTHITSGGAGTMGFALPAALGVALAHPAETVWAVVGDGGFQMTSQELATLCQEGVRNVKIAVVNNGHLGMVRQWQELFEGRRYSETALSGPDFARLAGAYGVLGLTVDCPEGAREAVARAWAHDGPAVIDFRVEQEANVFPIVPQGRGIGEMLLAGGEEAGATPAPALPPPPARRAGATA